MACAARSYGVTLDLWPKGTHGKNLGINMSFSFEYIRNRIVKIASDTTGDDVEVLLRAGRLQIAAARRH
jgi:hypothetical protein